MEHDNISTRFQPLHYNSRTGERGMTTKRNFSGGSEPTQTIIIPFPNQKSRLTQIVFRCNPLEQSVIRKPFHQHHSRRITCERASSKGIKMIYRQSGSLHDSLVINEESIPSPTTFLTRIVERIPRATTRFTEPATGGNLRRTVTTQNYSALTERSSSIQKMLARS